MICKHGHHFWEDDAPYISEQELQWASSKGRCFCFGVGTIIVMEVVVRNPSKDPANPRVIGEEQSSALSPQISGEVQLLLPGSDLSTDVHKGRG